ncbi:hypothetical protein BH23GEM7_BH23GEM7_13880 [soil metagenome]
MQSLERIPTLASNAQQATDALRVLAAALGMGVLAWLLLWEADPGVNVSVWIGSLLLAVRALAHGTGVELTGEGRIFFLPAFLFAVAIAWRDADSLAALNLLAVLMALALGASGARTGRLRTAGVAEYLRGLFLGAAHAATGMAFLALGEVRWRETPLPGRSGEAAAVLRGVLLATPLLFLFGILFVAADPVFERGIATLFRWQSEDLVASLLWIGASSWISAGFLRQLLLVGEPEWRLLPRLPQLSLGGTEVATVLALLNVLFGAFVLVQLRYLFGGAALVEATVGLSYAEYARRGFFELVAVAALLLPVLLGLDALLRRDRLWEEWRFRLLAGALVGLLFLILASAAQRMRLYTGEYGLTELRLHTSAFMVWLALVFLWLAATVLRGRRERFAWGAMWMGLGVLALLNVLNPHALIVRTNVQQTSVSGRFDASYLAGLGADAVPALVEALPALAPQERCQVAANLLLRAERWAEQERDWRAWNHGAARARRVVQENEAALQAIACSARSARADPAARLAPQPH